MPRSSWTIATCLGLVALSAASAAAQKPFTDDRYGFKFTVPKDFTIVPINMDEKWVIGKWLYKRQLESKSGYAMRKPELRVIVFPKVDMKEHVKRRGEKATATTKTKDGTKVVVNLGAFLQNPFRNYHEYLRENYKKGGWFVTKEKKTKIAGLPAIEKEIAVEEKMGSGTKSTLFAWEIDYGDAWYVIQLEVLADHAKKFKKPINIAGKRFKKVPRSQALTSATTGGAKKKADEIVKEALDQLTPKERRKKREDRLQGAVARAKDRMTSGWKFYVAGPFTVFYSTDTKFAKRVSKQAVLMWKYMDKHFGYIGEDTSIGSIIRICSDRSEASSYVDTSSRSTTNYGMREIVLWDDKDWGFNDSGSGRLNQRILRLFLYDKNHRLWWSLPPWIDWGMALYIDSLKMKGSKLQPKPDEWDMEVIREALRDKKFKKSQELLKVKYDQFKATQADRVQCFAMVDYMLNKGRRHKKFGKAFHDYMKALDVKLRELAKLRSDAWKAAREAAKEDKKNPDDEEKKAWDSEWKAKRDKIYDELFDQVFGKWTDKDWRNFDKAWMQAYKR